MYQVKMVEVGFTLAWKIPWMEEPGGYSPQGHKELDPTERPHCHFHFLRDEMWAEGKCYIVSL